MKLLMEKQTLQLNYLSVNVMKKLQGMKKVLLRAMFEANEVTVPSTFIILPNQLKLNSVDIQEDANNVIKFFNFIINAWITATELVGYQQVYFYLIDEYTGKPIIPNENDPDYPILIQILPGQELIKKISPFLSTGLKFAATINNVSGVLKPTGLLKTMGLPESLIPFTTEAETYIKTFSAGNSVSDFESLSDYVNSANISSGANATNQSTKGASLRELTRFFAEKDPNGTFCGLRRVAVDLTGQCIWTTEENYTKMVSEGDGDINLADLYNNDEVEKAIILPSNSNEVVSIVPAVSVPNEQDDTSSETDKFLSFKESSMSIAVTNQTNIEHYDDLNDTKTNDDDVGAIKNDNDGDNAADDDDVGAIKNDNDGDNADDDDDVGAMKNDNDGDNADDDDDVGAMKNDNAADDDDDVGAMKNDNDGDNAADDDDDDDQKSCWREVVSL